MKKFGCSMMSMCMDMAMPMSMMCRAHYPVVASF